MLRTDGPDVLKNRRHTTVPGDSETPCQSKNLQVHLRERLSNVRNYCRLIRGLKPDSLFDLLRLL